MKKFIKSIFSLVFIVGLAISLTGCESKINNKVYESHGLEITLPDTFFEKSLASSTAYFENTEAIISALKETFEDLAIIQLDKNSTLDDYIDAVMYNNQKKYEIKTKNNLKYFTYENESNGKTFFYLSTVYKSHDAFWLVSFACEEDKKDEYESKFLEWAETVNFK